MSTPTGFFECMGDASGGDLGSRFAVLTTVWFDPSLPLEQQQTTHGVIFDTPACEYGRSVLIPHREWYEHALDSSRVEEGHVGETVVWPPA